MNGEEGVNLDAFEPSWMEDGLGIQGERPNVVDEDLQEWDTNAWSNNQQEDDFTGGGGSPLSVRIATITDFPAGETIVIGVNEITLDSSVFKIHDNGGGEVQIKCK